MKLHRALLLATLTLGTGLAACENKPETPVEKLEDKVLDGLDARPNEALKDAGEDASDAMKNAGEAMKEAGQDASQAIEDAGEKVKEAVTPEEPK